MLSYNFNFLDTKLYKFENKIIKQCNVYYYLLQKVTIVKYSILRVEQNVPSLKTQVLIESTDFSTDWHFLVN